MGLGVEEVEVLARHDDLDVLVDADPRPRAEAGDGVGDALAEELLGRVGVTGVDPLGVDRPKCTISSEPSASTSRTVAFMRRSGGASVTTAASSKSSGRMPTTTRLPS